MDTVKVVKVIFCDKKRRGKGVELDPIRVIPEIFDLKGKLIMESDPEKNYTTNDMAHFALYVAKEDWKNIDILTLLRDWDRALTI